MRRAGFLIALLALPPLAAAGEDTQAITFSDTPLFTLGAHTSLSVAARTGPMFLHGKSSVERESFFATNQRAPTGVAARLAFTPTPDLTLAFEALGAVTFNASDDLRLHDNAGGTEGALLQADAVLDMRRFGRFTLGYGRMVSDGLAEQDLSGTEIVTGADLRLIGGDFAFDESVSGLHGPTGRQVLLNDVYYGVDGLGRRPRARFDSPVWRDLQLSASVDTRGAYDWGLRWRRDFAGGARAAVAFGGASGLKTPRERKGEQWTGGFSLVTKWGTGATMAFSSPDPWRVATDKDRAEFFYYGKVSQTVELFDGMPTSLSLDYGFSQWWRRPGEDVEKYGVAIVQTFRDGAVSAFASLHTADLDEVENSEVDETQTVAAGVSVRF